jgi:serine/threonine protein kinase
MPALDEAVIADVTARLKRHLATLGSYGEPQYLKAGGSAAVYKVQTNSGFTAWKAFNPSFLAGTSGEAERSRLDVQRRLMNHQCPSLIQTLRVDEEEGTAFVEMEFNPWTELKDVLDQVPDAQIIPLISQLVEAVRFLETKGIVHRDIKPENIHVSEDFKNLKLLDLGVARDIEPGDEQDAGLTDHGNLRPFLAKAQYSSPEYLFRLDEPSPKLWKGLNIYQVGAVLHDLIMKKPLFSHEMELGNRWLVARAVLSKVPSFTDTDTNRLSSLKALSSRCLTKDADSRLQQVDWSDFNLGESKDPLSALEARLSKKPQYDGATAKALAQNRLEFERKEYCQRLIDHVRGELNHICAAKIPLNVLPSISTTSYLVEFLFTIESCLTLVTTLRFDWKTEMSELATDIFLTSFLQYAEQSPAAFEPTQKLVVTGTIREVEDITFKSIASTLAECVMRALDIKETAVHDSALTCTDVLS